MGKRRRRTERHAEGEHGPKTEARIVEQLQSSTPEIPTDARLELERADAAYEGKRRLLEDRQQRDEAEKNSEHKRLFVEHTRGPDGLPEGDQP